MKRIGLITLIVALLAAGCGGGDKDKGAQNASASDSTPTTTAEGGGTAPAGQTPGAQQSQGTGGSGGESGGGTTTTTARSGSQPATQETTPKVPVEMKVEKDCVRRGPTGDEQTLVVKTKPGDTVAWSTAYSDGSNELSNPAYKTGSGYAKADDKGNFKTSWKLPPDAPLGTATLHTIAQGDFGPKLTFKVVAADGKC